MKSALRTAACCALLATATVFGGCVTSPTAATAGAQTPPRGAGTATAAGEAPAREAMTGSRLPSKSTDRLLRTTGAAGAKEMERDRAPDPGPRVN